MRWAQRLKRIFQIDVETCPNCGGTVKIIACTRDGSTPGLLALRANHPCVLACTRDGSTPGLLALRANRPCVLACAEDPAVIERILRQLAGKDLPGLWPESRAPPVQPATSIS